MSSSTFAPPSSSSDPAGVDSETRALSIAGWSALALLIAAVLTFGVDRHLHLGLFAPAARPLGELELFKELNRIAGELGLSRQADTRGNDLEKDPAKLAAVRRELDALVAGNPTSVRAVYYQAVERMASHDFAGARAAAGRGLKLKPDDLQFLLLQGAASASDKNYPEAEKAFRRVIEIEPRALPAYDNLGQTLWLMGRREEAAAVYRQRAAVEGRLAAPPATPPPATPPEAAPAPSAGN